MKTIPISDVPAQTLQVTLNGQACRIQIRQTSTGLYLDLYVQDAPIITSVLCLNRNRIVRNGYLGFVGDLAFVDMLSDSDPGTPGLGSQFVLCYLELGDLGAGE